MNPLIQLAASALPGEKKYILFAGAGVSKDAGVPTAWDLMLETAKLLFCADGNTGNPSISELSEWFVNSAYAEMSYSDLIGSVYPQHPEQQAFLSKFLGVSKPGDAHHLIAELARRDILRAIITTNFDNYLEQALEQLQIPVQVISNDDDLLHSEPLIHCKAFRIYKPHGTLGRGSLRNTPEDLKSLSPAMEEELIRVTGEHGVIVLGYSGADPGIMTVLRERKRNWYPLFWVNPSRPEGDAGDLVLSHGYSYIECAGAAAFLRQYLDLLDRLTEMFPSVWDGPTLDQLESCMKTPGAPVEAIWRDFTDALLRELTASRVDLSRFSSLDDAIVEQITAATPVSVRFTEAALLSARYRNAESARVLWSSFGKFAPLLELPERFSGSFNVAQHDGFKFIVYEMLVSLVAALVRNDCWSILNGMLPEPIFIERKVRSEYVTVRHFRTFLPGLDQLRNLRLNLRRASVTADILHQRLTTGRLVKLLSFKDFANADYLLFLFTVVQEKRATGPSGSIPLPIHDTWVPYSALYLDGPPPLLARAESKRFLQTLAETCGFSNAAEFAELVQDRYAEYRRFFENALIFPFDFNARFLGTVR